MIALDLSGKTILMTGALGAIAEHMVRRLTEAGAALVLTDIKPAEVADGTLEGEINGQVLSSDYGAGIGNRL
jgi:NAD(P)-dependent dehydrogenase (short-subunit alcohol dehydrogenase family)